MRNIANCEDVAGHMYRMSIMAFLLNDEVSLNVDRNKYVLQEIDVTFLVIKHIRVISFSLSDEKYFTCKKFCAK